MGSGEKSRFILQLENELAEVNKSIHIVPFITNINIGQIPDEQLIYIQKNNNILQLISEKAKTGFSASALNVYRNCSLKFYFREILKLKESVKIEADIEFNVFGNAIHEVLEKIYIPFIDKPIDPEKLKEVLPKVDTMLDMAFKANFKGGNIVTGKNHLIYEVAKKYIKQFLMLEIEDALTPLKKIIGLEEKLELTLDIKDQEVKLKGYLDRIEKMQQDDHTRIIDYKTGKVEPRDLTLKDWEELHGKAKDKLFQLLFYAYLYEKKYQPALSPQLGIYSLRMLSYGFIEPKLPGEENYFEEYLFNLIGEIFDPSVQFEQTTDENICSYCDYREICNK
jgi:CRISPR/Cas system-associated exonuclease Cas4 (RecB family)